MSAGIFVRVFYQSDYDDTVNLIHPIRIQPETAAAAIGSTTNAAPTTGITNPISAVTSRNNRQLGLIPRTVSLQAPATGQPAGYKPLGVTVIPALNRAFYNAAIPGATCTYLGASFTVIGRQPERAQ